MKSGIALLFVFLITLAPAVAKEPKIYALVIGDATPAAQWGKLLPNITLDVLAIQVMLWENQPAERLELISMTLESNEDAKPANILSALAELKPTEDDTLLVYYTGHGAVDDHGHYFAIAGGKLYRDDLKREMQRRKPRLAILISDCCNVRSDGKAYMAPAPEIKEPSIPTPIITALFLEPRGVVDLNGSSPGESSFFVPEAKLQQDLPGSIFTKAFTKYVREHRKTRPTWNDLLLEVGTNVHLAFRTGYPQGAKIAKGSAVQHDQTVYAIEYPNMPEKQGPRTGFKIRDENGRGAMIFAVDAASPAAKVYDLTTKKYVSLRPGQLIVSANGKPITSASDLSAVVVASPQILRFTIEDGRSKTEYLMRLRY